ncbi:hypothetical protein NODU109028_02410 [Nocardioides dubius]|uniref:Bulb-type lectin domain-containing protein n=2 Tax=Nocardioides dubius TaxID=317019 RepID=A0ABN1TQ89_9ACTN
MTADQTPSHRAPQAERSTTTLFAGQALVAGTSRSELTNGWYTLTVTSGDVELRETIPLPGRDGTSSTSTGTWFRTDTTGWFSAERDRTRLRLRRNGDLALVTSRGRQLWHSGTKGSGAVQLNVRGNGALTLTTKSGKVVWRSHSGQTQMSGGMRLKPGQKFRNAWETAFSGGKVTTLTMQRDGNLVQRCGSMVTWQSRTHVRGSELRMSRTGVLRVVTPKGRVAWRASGGPNRDYAWFNSSSMIMQSLDATGIKLIWQANTKLC